MISLNIFRRRQFYPTRVHIFLCKNPTIGNFDLKIFESKHPEDIPTRVSIFFRQRRTKNLMVIIVFTECA